MPNFSFFFFFFFSTLFFFTLCSDTLSFPPFFPPGDNHHDALPQASTRPPGARDPPDEPKPFDIAGGPALALTTTFADLPNDCIIDILSFVGTPFFPFCCRGGLRDLGRALCAAPWLRELGVHAWAAAVRRRWPAWAAIADAAREKRAIAGCRAPEQQQRPKAEEIAWRRQAELFELREREELAIAPLVGGAIAKRQRSCSPGTGPCWPSGWPRYGDE